MGKLTWTTSHKYMAAIVLSLYTSADCLHCTPFQLAHILLVQASAKILPYTMDCVSLSILTFSYLSLVMFAQEGRLRLAPPAILKVPGGRSIAKLISGHILSGLLAKFKTADAGSTIESVRCACPL